MQCSSSRSGERRRPRGRWQSADPSGVIVRTSSTPRPELLRYLDRNESVGFHERKAVGSRRVAHDAHRRALRRFLLSPRQFVSGVVNRCRIHRNTSPPSSTRRAALFTALARRRDRDRRPAVRLERTIGAGAQPRERPSRAARLPASSTPRRCSRTARQPPYRTGAASLRSPGPRAERTLVRSLRGRWRAYGGPCGSRPRARSTGKREQLRLLFSRLDSIMASDRSPVHMDWRDPDVCIATGAIDTTTRRKAIVLRGVLRFRHPRLLHVSSTPEIYDSLAPFCPRNTILSLNSAPPAVWRRFPASATRRSRDHAAA